MPSSPSRSRSRSKSNNGGRTLRSRSRSNNGRSKTKSSGGGKNKKGRSRSSHKGRSKKKSRSRSQSSGTRGATDQSDDRSADSNSSPRSTRKNTLMVNYDQYENSQSQQSFFTDEGEGGMDGDDDVEGGGGNLNTNGRRARGWKIQLNRSSSHNNGSRSRSRSPRRRRMRGRKMNNPLSNINTYRPTFARLRPTPRSRNNTGAHDDDNDINGEGYDFVVKVNSSTSNHRHSSANKHQHPFILPANRIYAPRMDVWCAFAVASCASIASIGQLHHASTNRGNGGSGGGLTTFSGSDKFALSTCAISFIWSFGVAVGMRYTPLRSILTKPLFIMGPRPLSILHLTVELILLAILLLFWIVSMPIVVNGNAYYTANREVPLAMAGADIWNANLFYSTWTSFLLCTYLFIEVLTSSSNHRRGTLPIITSSSSNPTPPIASNTLTKRWTLLTFNTLILFSASIGTYTSPACTGSLLKQTSYCTRAFLGIFLGGGLQLVVMGFVGLLYLLSSNPMLCQSLRQRRGGRYSRRSGGGGGDGDAIVSPRKRDMGGSVCAFLSLILQSITAGLLTSPTGGGPGNISGTLYFSCWFGFVLVLELGLRYLDLFSTATARGRAGGGATHSMNLIENETFFEDEEEEDDISALMLRNGSEQNEGSSRRSRGSTSSSSRRRRQQLVVPQGQSERQLVVEVEDASMAESDMMDGAESFVFSQANQWLEPTHYSTAIDNESSTVDSRSRASRRSPSNVVPPTQHFGSAPLGDPEENAGPSRRQSSRSPSGGSVQIGSIDARSAKASRSSNEASSTKVEDPDGASSTLKKSVHYNDFDYDIDDDFSQDLHNGHLLDGNKSGGSTDPDAVFTSFGMDRVEKLESVQEQQHLVMKSSLRNSAGTNLSPLEEEAESSPQTMDDSSKSSSNVEDYTPQRERKYNQQTATSQQVGDNLRTMQAMRMHQQSQDQQFAAQSAAVAGSSSKKSSLSRSSLGNLTGGASGGRTGGMGMHSSSGGGQVSRHSRQSVAKTLSTRSHRSSQESANVTVKSEKSRSIKTKSSASRKSRRSGQSSATTMSSISHGLSANRSAILTDDDNSSGSHPPPTISDGMSTKDGLSEFSGLENNKRSTAASGSRGGANSSGRNNRTRSPAVSDNRGPPPPPFRRSQADESSLYSYSDPHPVRSILAKEMGDNDTIVSDPTLDAGFDYAPPSPQGRPKMEQQGQKRSSASTGSYDKRYSDETEMQRTSSDDNPSSQGGEGSNLVVDNIVAAALAYAEKTHGNSDNEGLSRVQGSSTTGASSAKVMKIPTKSKSSYEVDQRKQQPQQARKSQSLRESHVTAASSSIHSFYTEDEHEDMHRQSHSTGNPRFAQAAASAGVDDLVAKALSHAQGTIDGRQPQQHQQPPASNQVWNGGAGKSVGSMYSEDTEFSNQEVGIHFDC